MSGNVVSAAVAHRMIGAVGTINGTRQPDDWYVTPPEAVEALLAVETFSGETWEPACGDGAISRILDARGMAVRSTDLVDRGYGTGGIDFLEACGRADNVITNPPFKHAQAFVERALQAADRKVAMLVRLTFLEGGRRRRLFDAHPPARVWVFSKRITCHRGGAPGTTGGLMAYAWLVWDKQHNGPPAIGWI